MEYIVSVDEALKKGRNQITYVSLLIFLGILGITIYLILNKQIHIFHLLTGFIIASILSLLNWSLKITKWKIWAFSNVRNINELKKKAVNENLLYKDNSFWNKTEISSKKQKEVWLEISKRFNEKDFYGYNILIPKETNIYYSKPSLKGDILGWILLLFLGIYAVNSEISGGFLFIIIGLITLFISLKNLFTKKEQLKLNDFGIIVKEEPIIKWAEIIDTNIKMEGYKSNIQNYLFINTNTGEVKIAIDELDIEQNELEDLINTYKFRNEKNCT